MRTTLAGAGNLAIRLKPHIRRSVDLALREYAIVTAFAILFIVLAVTSDVFLTIDNLLNLLEQSAPLGIIAVGGTLVIIAGGFDLSVGAIYALAGIVAAEVANAVDPIVGLAAGAALGTAVGSANGFLTTTVRINALIATIASALVVRGLAILVTGGFVISVADPSFREVGTGEFLGIRWIIWLFAAFAAACAVLLHRSVLGRYIFAAGGNAEAARLSGIRVGWVRALTFIISGLAAGIAGVVAASSLGSGQADVGVGLELTAIAAIVVGGTSIAGGVGAIWRTVVGVLFLALINNGLNLLAIDPTYQQIVQGAIILVAVGADSLSRRR